MTGGQQTHAAVWFSLKRPLTVITRWLRQSRATPHSIRACLPLHCLPPSLPPVLSCRPSLPTVPHFLPSTSVPPIRPSRRSCVADLSLPLPIDVLIIVSSYTEVHAHPVIEMGKDTQAMI